jgi:hypothetical protein
MVSSRQSNKKKKTERAWLAARQRWNDTTGTSSFQISKTCGFPACLLVSPSRRFLTPELARSRRLGTNLGTRPVAAASSAGMNWGTGWQLAVAHRLWLHGRTRVGSAGVFLQCQPTTAHRSFEIGNPWTSLVKDTTRGSQAYWYNDSRTSLSPCMLLFF